MPEANKETQKRTEELLRKLEQGIKIDVEYGVPGDTISKAEFEGALREHERAVTGQRQGKGAWNRGKGKGAWNRGQGKGAWNWQSGKGRGYGRGGRGSQRGRSNYGQVYNMKSGYRKVGKWYSDLTDSEAEDDKVYSEWDNIDEDPTDTESEDGI